MTTLLAQLEAKWRDKGIVSGQYSVDIHDPYSRAVAIGETTTFTECAEDLHATVAQLSCETCKFAGGVNDHWKMRQCHLEDEIFSVEGVALADKDGAIVVPLIFNNKPFFCAAHTPRPTDTETT